jgi:tetratricopeptide (TPR) repeat protein
LLNTANPKPSGIAAASDLYILPPKIYIATSQQQSRETINGRSSEIQHFFEDAFASSSQVRLAVADGTEIRPKKGQNAYLFESQIVNGPTGAEVNFSLTSLIRNETIWSTTIAMPDSAADYPEKLGPIASRVASIYGVIATDQRKRLPDDAMIGYACLLRFDSYRANRDPDLLPIVESCIKKSLAADPLDSRILAAASFLSFLREQATGRKPDPEAGLEYARRAMVRGREGASANFALARSSFFNGNCSRGKEFAEKATELDPYEATIQAQTGAYLFACADPDSVKYLRRAIALDPRGSIVAETALVLTLLVEGKDKEALEFAERIVPSSTGVGPYYDIAMAMVYAKNGRIEDSRASWDRLVTTYGSEKDESQEQLLRRLITNPMLADRAFQLLVRTGVITG